MAYNLIEYPRFRHINPDTGEVAAGWKVYTYKAGTLTAQTTYTDKELATPNTNPIILDSDGEAIIYTGVALKIALYDDSDVLKWTQDYLAVVQDVIIRAEQDDLTNNWYEISSSPAQAALVDNQMVIFQPDTDNDDTLQGTVFTGTGIDDAEFDGPYSGSTSASAFKVEIDATGTPDTFEWTVDGGGGATGVAITGAPQTLQEGITVLFAKTSGHTLGDYWTLTVERPARVNLDGLGNKVVYKNVGGILQELDGSDMKANMPVTIVYSLASDAWILNNPSAPDLSVSSLNITRPRRELATNHTVSSSDWGWELAFTGSRTVTLPAATNFGNMFLYILNAGTGTITINANGAEKIYWPFDTTGKSTILMQPDGYYSIQLASNSVDWHVLSASSRYRGMARYATPGADSWTCPDNVTTIYVTACPGGGGGAGATATGANVTNAGGGGEPGIHLWKAPYTVVPGTAYPTAVGAAGAAGAAAGAGGNGGNTSLGPAIFVLSGGTGGALNAGIYADNLYSIGTDGRSGGLGIPGRGGHVTSGPGSMAGGAVGTGAFGSGGGGGAVWDAAGAGTSVGGGVGAQGILIIEW